MPPILIGREMTAASSCSAGRGRPRILATASRRVVSSLSHRWTRSSDLRDRCRCRRFFCTHTRRTSRACWCGRLMSLATVAASWSIFSWRNCSLAARAPTQVSTRLLSVVKKLSKVEASLSSAHRRPGKEPRGSRMGNGVKLPDPDPHRGFCWKSHVPSGNSFR
jgi:hypothetical protein